MSLPAMTDAHARTQLLVPETAGFVEFQRSLSPAHRNRSGTSVVAILPRGEAIRNFVHSGTLGALQREVDVAVLTVVPSDDVLAALMASGSRILPLESIRDRYPVRILRELLDLAHGRHIWSEAARERWRLRDQEATTLTRRLKRWGKKAACYPFAGSRGLATLERAERLASRMFPGTRRYDALFRELKPKLVFNGSHVHSHIAVHAVNAAQRLGIPTAAFIFSWDNLTSQGRIVPTYDYYLVWSERMKSELLTLYPAVREDQVFVTGTPQFDPHRRPETFWSREEFCARVGADPRRPIVLYSTGMPEFMAGEPRIVEQVADMLAEMTDLGAPQLLVRIYPKDLTGRFNDLKQRRPDILFPEARWIDAWFTPTEQDTQLLVNTVCHVDVGINVASTISLELCMFDRPVLNVAYDPPGDEMPRTPYARYYDFDHYRPLVERGAVQVARSADELRTLLRASLVNPSRGRAERNQLIKEMFGNTLDGRSAERVADVLVRLANRRVSPHA